MCNVSWKVKKEQGKWWKSITAPGFEDREAFDKQNDIPTYSLSTILKLHRAETLLANYDLFEFPISDGLLGEQWDKQVLIHSNVYTAETLVLFVHDFGNLRMEFEKPKDISPKAELSYLVDSSALIINWAKEQGYSLIDINMLLPLELEGSYGKGSVKNFPKSEKESTRRLMLYLWDNLVSVATAENIVIIGYGYGCEAVMSLINNRDVMTKTKAIVEVLAMNAIPKIQPKNNHIIPWFKQISRVFIPRTHPRLEDKPLESYGSVVSVDQTKAIFILKDSIPLIQEFVDDKINPIKRVEVAEEQMDYSNEGGLAPAPGPSSYGITEMDGVIIL